MDQGNFAHWQPVAPAIAEPVAADAPPLWRYDDALGAARADFVTTEPISPLVNGYAPSWAFVMPWGVGDAPQHPWSTRWMAPVDNRGPGDNPATYFRSLNKPIILNFAMRYQGMAVDGGNMLMTGLYTPAPLDAMSAAIYGPNGG